jgi:hypothetical protein
LLCDYRYHARFELTVDSFGPMDLPLLCDRANPEFQAMPAILGMFASQYT